MALGEVILICLTERPMSGYELAKAFDTSVGFFWRADHQQIYRELARLRDRGYVQSQEVIQSGKPNKLVYSLTDLGRAHIRHWSRQPSKPTYAKDDLLVRVYALESIDLPALRADLMARLEFHRDKLRRFENILERHFSGHPLTTRETGRLLGLKMGMRYEAGWADWCEEAIGLLPQHIDVETVVPLQAEGGRRAASRPGADGA